jgi:hypothetical protein
MHQAPAHIVVRNLFYECVRQLERGLAVDSHFVGLEFGGNF